MKRRRFCNILLFLLVVFAFAPNTLAANTINETVDASTIEFDPDMPKYEDHFPVQGITLKKTTVYAYMQSTSKKVGVINKGVEITVHEFFDHYIRIIDAAYPYGRGYINIGHADFALKNPVEGEIRSKTYVYTAMRTGKKYRGPKIAAGTAILVVARHGAWWEILLGGKTYFAKKNAVSIPFYGINTD